MNGLSFDGAGNEFKFALVCDRSTFSDESSEKVFQSSVHQ